MAYIHTTVVRKQQPLSDHRQTFDQLCLWIDQHLDEPLGWQELMHQSGLDHLTLKALFHKFQSRTPMTWIRQRREARLAPGVATEVEASGLQAVRRAALIQRQPAHH